ncbi:MAG TPA: hypothetical protein PLG22_07330 [Kiritimatiellia bacterium]|nr:hypothetical protein [Kiritimatiellia bacterium]
MKKVTMMIAAACLALAGCKTAKDAAGSFEELGKAYYSQTNCSEILRVEGTNLTFTVTGATLLSLATPVPPKQIMPRETSWYDATADILKTIAPWVFMGYMFHEADIGSGTKTSTVNNYAQ